MKTFKEAFGDSSLLHRASDRSPVDGWGGMAVCGSVVAAVLAAPYGKASHVFGAVWLLFWLPIVLGGIIGAAIAACGFRVKVRSGLTAGVAGLTAGVVGWYLAWVAYVYFASEGTSLLVAAPRELFAVMRSLSTTGTWSFEGDTPTGGLLWGIWSLELLAIVAGSMAIPIRLLTTTPFCEGCDEWTSAFRDFPRFVGQDVDELLEALSRGDEWRVADLRLLEGPASTWLELELSVCGKCKTVGFLTVYRATRQPQSVSGMPSKTHQVVVDNVAVGLATVDRLQGLRRRPN